MRVLVLLCLMLFNVSCYAQKSNQCDVTLLSQFKAADKCGVVKTVEKLKFKVILKSMSLNDTVILYVLCPSDYPNSFWEANKTYHVDFERRLSAVKSSIVVDCLSKRDKRYKIIGVILNASKK